MTVEATFLSNEFTRIGTYIGWKSNGKPRVIDLVKAGFYYTGCSDTVRCFSCGIEVKDWQQNADPVAVHGSVSSGCAFVANASNSSRQDYVPSVSEQDGSSSGTVAMVVPLTSCDVRHTSQLARKETVSNLAVSACNSLCYRGLFRRISNTSQNSSQVFGPGCETSCQISSANTLDSRGSNASCSLGQRGVSSRPRIQRRRSDGVERASTKHSKTIANRQYSNSHFHPTEFQTSEEARIQTYTRWASISEARAREFAHAGFIYTGPADRVQCVFCNGMLHQWKSDDSPADEHCKHFPGCRFVVEYLSVVKLAVPKHAKYRTEASRLGSFRDWEPSKDPKPTALAKAGFFYTGRRDRVRCFSCNGGLCEWDPNDDPWREHARWFPTCPFVKQSKGQAFINAVLSSTNLTNIQAAALGITRERLVAKQYIRKIIDDKVTTQMDSPVIKAVLRLDIPKKLVKKAIKQRFSESGEDFANETALLEAVFGVNKKSGQDSENTKELRARVNGAKTSPSSKNFLLLAEENQLLKEQKLCKVCLDEDACVAFIPCGHLVCSSCAPAVTMCPMCRAKITGTIRTYMS